jgi:nucleotide-binding universal stress UspA family protein
LGSEKKIESGFSMKSIVFATDFLESSRLALDYAVGFAHRYDATLTIVHVFDLSPEAEEVEVLSRRPCISREHALIRLEGFASGVRRLGIRTEIDLRAGGACAAVLSSAEYNNADLLVLGTHGVFRGLQHLVIGSNAEKILLSAHCPTLTVGRHVMAGIDLNLKFNEILFVSDFTLEAAAAASYALSLGQDLKVPVELLQIAPEDTGISPQLIHRYAEQYCNALASDPSVTNREWCIPGYQFERSISASDVLERAKRAANSLMVLGVRPASRLDRHLHTSFAYELVAKASCPIVSVHKREGTPK